MKKSLLLVVVFSFAVSTTVQAQSKEEPYDLWDLLLGVKAGVSVSTLTKVNGDYKFCPTANIYTEVFVNPHFSMTFEAGYSRKGINNVIVTENQIYRIAEDMRDQYYYGPNHPYTYNLDYINTGYLLKYYFNQHIGIYSGICFSTMVNAKSTVADVNWNIKKHLHSSDYNIPIGAEIVLGKNFMIDGRWNWSPRKVTNSNHAFMLLGKAHNQTFTLTVGYKTLLF